MAASKPTTRTAGQSYRRQALIWLVMTLLLGVVTALVWMLSQTPAMGAKIENEPISTPQISSTELEQPLKIESLHELDTDVQPINFDATVRDLRNYPDEFKDKRYLLANKGKWTVQVMNVAENDVIVSYLEGRDDRKKFSYFRYLDEDNQVRYMLTYGLMSSPQEAVGAAKLIDFKLPADVRVLPEEINRYVSIIDNYERPDPVKDLSTRRTRSVNLRPTKREVPVRRQASNDQTASSNDQGAGNSSSEEGIRQSADTSETLSVNEERIIGGEEQTSSVESPNNENSTDKPAQDNKKPAGADGNTLKKPPVVPTPKPPSNNNGENSSPNTANKNTNGNASGASKSDAPKASAPKASTPKPDAPKANVDSMKALIEDKNN